jgi:hypothetical protein
MYEWLSFFVLFVAFYSVFMVVAWAIDKVLRYTCNKGLFPKDYFKW